MTPEPTYLPSWLEDESDPIYRFATKRAWEPVKSNESARTNPALRALRVSDLSVRGLMANDATTYAASMTYTAVLSIVPLLAFCFSVAKGFGLYDKLVKQTLPGILDENLGSATGEGASQLRVAVDQILAFVEKTDASSLGIAGLLAFLYTAIGLLKSLENAFNRIFRVASPRSFGRKIVDYTALLVLSPVVLAISTGITSALRSNSFVDWVEKNLHVGPGITVLFKLLGFALLVVSFAFVYNFIPNTKVKWKAALIGGVVGGGLWQILQILLVKANVGLASYNQLYAGFAAFPIFLFWMYLSWTATMLGAHVTWACQAEAEYTAVLSHGSVDARNREENAVRLLCLLAQRFSAGTKPPTTHEVGRALGLSSATIAELVDDLAARDILERSTKGGRIVLSRSLDGVTLSSVVAAVRRGDIGEQDGADMIDATLARLRREEGAVAAASLTIADLLASRSPPKA